MPPLGPRESPPAAVLLVTRIRAVCSRAGRAGAVGHQAVSSLARPLSPRARRRVAGTNTFSHAPASSRLEEGNIRRLL